MPQDEYNWIARGYDTLIEPFNRSLRPIALKLFRPAAGAAILDVGCGTGTQLAFYSAQGFHPAGIDLSGAMLAVARTRRNRRTLISRGDAARMPFRSRPLTGPWQPLCCMKWRQTPDPRCLLDMKRILKESGRLGIVDYHPARAPTLKGWLSRAFIRGVEFAAGRRHFTNYRAFYGGWRYPDTGGPAWPGDRAPETGQRGQYRHLSIAPGH